MDYIKINTSAKRITENINIYNKAIIEITKQMSETSKAKALLQITQDIISITELLGYYHWQCYVFRVSITGRGNFN